MGTECVTIVQKKLLETTVCKAAATIPCITRACRAVSCACSMPVAPTVLLALGTLVPAVAGAHLAHSSRKAHTWKRCSEAMQACYVAAQVGKRWLIGPEGHGTGEMQGGI